MTHSHKRMVDAAIAKPAQAEAINPEQFAEYAAALASQQASIDGQVTQLNKEHLASVETLKGSIWPNIQRLGAALAEEYEGGLTVEGFDELFKEAWRGAYVAARVEAGMDEKAAVRLSGSPYIHFRMALLGLVHRVPTEGATSAYTYGQKIAAPKLREQGIISESKAGRKAGPPKSEAAKSVTAGQLQVKGLGKGIGQEIIDMLTMLGADSSKSKAKLEKLHTILMGMTA